MKKGFTLIELLVVVLIIGILSSIAVPQYTKIIAKAKLSKILQQAGHLQQAGQRYISLNGTFPGTHGTCTPPSCTTPVLFDISFDLSDPAFSFEEEDMPGSTALCVQYNAGKKGDYHMCYVANTSVMPPKQSLSIYSSLVKYTASNNYDYDIEYKDTGVTACGLMEGSNNLCGVLEPVIRQFSPWNVSTFTY